MKWFFFASFLVGLLLCGFLLSMIALALFTHLRGEWLTVVVILTPFVVVFGWATRQMFRAFRRQGQTGTTIPKS